MSSDISAAPRWAEWKIAIAVAILTTIILSIPYLLGYTLANPSTEYMGIVMNPEDSGSYFAKMLEGYDGNWLYTIPFTSEEHSPEFVGGFYIALGHLARFLGLPIISMWHISRIASDLILFLVIFDFIGIFLPDALARWVGYLLALFGSGLGWLLFVLNQPNWLGETPVDFKMPESHIFFTALTFPHVAIGIALILLSFRFSLRTYDVRPRPWVSAILAGIANLLLAIVYPFMIFSVLLTNSIYWLYRTSISRRPMVPETMALAISALIPAPLLLYYALTLATNPIFRAWETQSITLSPPLPHYLLAFGPMLLLAVLTPKREHAGMAFLWCWVFAVALLVCAPLNAQRRFVEGIHVALAILASAGLVHSVLPWLERTRAFSWLATLPGYSVVGLRRLTIASLLFLMSISNFYILASTSITASIQPIYPLFRLRSETDAVDWLRSNTARSDIVLGAYETGNLIAARAGNHVVLGHWAETADWAEKVKEIDEFYRGSLSQDSQSDFLARYKVSYVFFGPRERAEGAFDPSQTDYLKRVFSNSVIQIFSVQLK
jgi:hypothetical protein